MPEPPAKPFKFDGDGGPMLPEDARFVRPLSPANAPWKPGMDQGAIPIKQGDIPWPPAEKTGKV